MMLAFLTSPLSKILGIFVVIAGLVAAGVIALHRHDDAVRAAAQVSADKAIAEAQEASRAHERAALQAQAKDDAARAASSFDLWKKTHAYGTAQACLNSPAVRALLDGLRSNSTNGAGAQN